MESSQLKRVTIEGKDVSHLVSSVLVKYNIHMLDVVSLEFHCKVTMTAEGEFEIFPWKGK
jgi:hypothetical protein